MLKKIVVVSVITLLMSLGSGEVAIHNDGGLQFDMGLQVVNAAEKKE